MQRLKKATFMDFQYSIFLEMVLEMVMEMIMEVVIKKGSSAQVDNGNGSFRLSLPDSKDVNMKIVGLNDNISSIVNSFETNLRRRLLPPC